MTSHAIRDITKKEHEFKENISGGPHASAKVIAAILNNEDQLLTQEDMVFIPKLIESLALKNAELDQTVSIMMTALKAAERQLQRTGPNNDEDDAVDMKALINKEMEAARAVAKCDPKKNKYYTEIMSKFDEEEDDDLMVMGTGGGANPHRLKCPLTGMQLVEPVKNKRCGHIYSKAAIEQHIRIKCGNNTNKDAPCPVVACSQGVKLSDLERDRAMEAALRARQAIESQTQQEQALEDDEMEEDMIMVNN